MSDWNPSSRLAGAGRRLLERSVGGAFLLIALCGCGSNLPDYVAIKGQVTLDGKPLDRGEVLYAPADPSFGRPAIGIIGKDGRFIMQTTEGIPGVIPGAYRIAVFAMEGEVVDPRTVSVKEYYASPPKPLVPERYSDPERSELMDTVDHSHSGSIQFDLVK